MPIRHKATPDFKKLVKQYYPKSDTDLIEEIGVYEVIILKRRGKKSGGLFTHTYVDGKKSGFKLEDKNGKIIMDIGTTLREMKEE